MSRSAERSNNTDASTPRLLVSIHDVTPAFRSEVLRLWNLCRQSGATPALLVVPEWHGEWRIEDDASFVDWLRHCVADGAEIILHGERHDEVGLPRSFGDSVRALGRTAREGEFLTLEYDAAHERIIHGLQRLRALQLEPIGFIPPAWLAREATHQVVRDAGLHMSEDAAGVRVHDGRPRLTAPALRWSGRTTVRALGSVAMASLRWRTQRSAPLIRLALHPQDLAHPLTARSVEREVARWLRHARQVRYAAL